MTAHGMAAGRGASQPGACAVPDVEALGRIIIT